MTAAAPLLAVHGLGVTYGGGGGGAPSLADVSLGLAAGEVRAVVGGSRSGKTTLLRAISGLLSLHGGRITAGRIDLDGDSVLGRAAASMVRLGLAHVPEGRRVFRELTVEENLRAGGFTVPGRSNVRARVDGVLDLFPLLARRRSTRAGYLSGGEQQLLVVARALMSSPRLLLLDEPTLGLAPAAVEQVADVVATAAGAGAAVLLAEHNVAAYGPAEGTLARATGASTIVLDRGRVVPPAAAVPAGAPPA